MFQTRERIAYDMNQLQLIVAENTIEQLMQDRFHQEIEKLYIKHHQEGAKYYWP
jgi:hypothetical protein